MTKMCHTLVTRDQPLWQVPHVYFWTNLKKLVSINTPPTRSCGYDHVNTLGDSHLLKSIVATVRISLIKWSRKEPKYCFNQVSTLKSLLRLSFMSDLLCVECHTTRTVSYMHLSLTLCLKSDQFDSKYKENWENPGFFFTFLSVYFFSCVCVCL